MNKHKEPTNKENPLDKVEDSSDKVENDLTFPEYQDSSKKTFKDPSKYNDKLWQSSYGTKDIGEESAIKFKLSNDYNPILSLNESSIELGIIEKSVVDFLENNKHIQEFQKLKKIPKKSEILFFYKITSEEFIDICCIEIFYCLSNYFGINDKRFFKYLDESDKNKLKKSLKNRGYL